MSSSDSGPSSKKSKQEGSTVFKGLVIAIHGPQAGTTKGGLKRLLEQHGAKVTERLFGNTSLSHVVLSGQLWVRQGTAGADFTIEQILKANKENATESDDDCGRVWLMPLEWVQESIEKGKKLKEVEYDFQRTNETKRAERAAELAAERRRNAGKSKYARGERRQVERANELKRALAEQKRLEQLGLGAQSFDGLSNIPGVVAPPQPAPATFSNRAAPVASTSKPIATSTKEPGVNSSLGAFGSKSFSLPAASQKPESTKSKALEILILDDSDDSDVGPLASKLHQPEPSKPDRSTSTSTAKKTASNDKSPAPAVTETPVFKKKVIAEASDEDQLDEDSA
ncbi:hypothetical protein JCM1840_005734 [Sporobolomyces johnsonii]